MLEPQDDDDFWSESTERNVDPLKKCTRAGHLSMICAWWHDDPELIWDAGRAVQCVPYLLCGHTENFTEHDWWLLADALGQYPDRDEILEELYRLCWDGWRGKLPPGPTKCFDDSLAELLDDVEPSSDTPLL